MNEFETFAKKRVVGHDSVLKFLDIAIKRIGVVKVFNGIEALFVLAGPKGCGKNFTAKVIADYLKKDMLILHMGEYAFSDDISRLIGTKGVLEHWINEHPDGLVIFEDIDKADNIIQRAIASIVSDGASDDVRRYQKSIFIFTFSLKNSAWYSKSFIEKYYDNRLLWQGKFYEEIAKIAFSDASERVIALFDSELISVLSEGDLFLFNLLELKELSQISEQVISQTIKQLNVTNKTQIDIQSKNLLALAVLLQFSPFINAKRISHKLPAILADLFANSCKDAQKCTLSVSKKVENWLQNFFVSSFDLKYFVKFDRYYELSWREKRRGFHCTLILDEISEIEPQKKDLDLQYEDHFAPQFSHIGFQDVAGQLRVKNELLDIIKLLKNDKELKHFDIDLPKGLLLYGPEGVGKTMLVKAFAKEAGLPFINLRSFDLFDEELVQNIYDKARVSTPIIVILEGVDTKFIIDGNFTPVPTGTVCEMIDRALSEPGNYIFTIATARSLEDVPSELMRPGRIDQSVEVPELDREARRFFAKKILEKPHENSIDIERITRYMSGMNGYELGRIAKEASLDAIRYGKDALSETIIIDRINTIKYGHKLERKRFKNFEEDLEKSAYHEAAHAVTSMILLPDIEIEQVTVIPRSESLGLVSYMQDAIETNLSKDEIEANIAVLLAGRLATIKKYGKDVGLETGAYSDLQEASLYAYSAVAQFGMDDELLNLHLETLLQTVSNELFKEKIESGIEHWIESGTKRAENIIDKRWKTIEKIANKLLKEEMIEGSELKSYLNT
ncbi:AAA family ATPase [Hydrogenimonas thermophila]|uniref:ATP-dependent Zn proteases n=1 Tax=Hydrogenimonas thermophila TaxID=223786 RepID=A0A1I5TB04_9BACT|nr:AAA family ATPase [Hydrogenimonas thermophila]SFP80148.1 ATP-dependent Zn proteases [Hydrogenimonas thermophila]